MASLLVHEKTCDESDDAGEWASMDVWSRVEATATRLRQIHERLPPNTAKLTVVFCLVPVAVASTTLAVAFVVNFGVALVIQTITLMCVLLMLIPCLAVGLTTALATAYAAEFVGGVTARLSSSPRYSLQDQTPDVINVKLKTN